MAAWETWEGAARTMPGFSCASGSSLLPPILACKVCSIEGDSSHGANVLLALRAYGHWPSKPGLSPWGSQPTLRGATLLFSSLEQDQEVLKSIQAAILQVQGEYEKLNSVMGSLLDDSRQQQKDIEVMAETPRGSEHPPGRAQGGEHKRFALWR